MVLKKPYAFLIKHFRLIHLIITAILARVAFQNRDVYKYLKRVIVDTTNRYEAALHINYGIFIYIIIALILCFLISWLLKYKDKPRTLYKFTIITYVIISIFVILLFSYMGTFNNVVVEQKTIRLYRDILTIVLLLQYYTVFVMLIRGLGFDIKKFDFNRDVQELNAEAADSEEVEVNTQIDTTNVMRLAHKGRREFGYFFKEFKVYIIIILVVVLGIIGYKGYNYLSVKLKVYNENEYFGNRNILKIENSYLTTFNNTEYVIIDFNIHKYGIKEQFNIGDLVLIDGKNKYAADKNKCYYFNNLGNCYKKQFVINDEKKYILVYEVGKLSNKNIYLLYTDYYDDTYKVKLNLKNY